MLSACFLPQNMSVWIFYQLQNIHKQLWRFVRVIRVLRTKYLFLLIVSLLFWEISFQICDIMYRQACFRMDGLFPCLCPTYLMHQCLLCILRSGWFCMPRDNALIKWHKSTKQFLNHYYTANRKIIRHMPRHYAFTVIILQSYFGDFSFHTDTDVNLPLKYSGPANETVFWKKKLTGLIQALCSTFQLNLETINEISHREIFHTCL